MRIRNINILVEGFLADNDAGVPSPIDGVSAANGSCPQASISLLQGRPVLAGRVSPGRLLCTQQIVQSQQSTVERRHFGHEYVVLE